MWAGDAAALGLGNGLVGGNAAQGWPFKALMVVIVAVEIEVMMRVEEISKQSPSLTTECRGGMLPGINGN